MDRTARTGRRRTERAFVAAATAGTVTGVLFLAGNTAVYRWIMPLTGETYEYVTLLANWLDIWVVSLPLCVWRTPRADNRPAGGRGQHQPVRPGPARLAGTGDRPHHASAGGPPDPACEITTTERTLPPPTRVTVPPGNYGADYASFSWIASFTVPRSGTYSITCRVQDNDALYAVGDIPRIHGAVGTLIHWPLATILLLGGSSQAPVSGADRPPRIRSIIDIMSTKLEISG